MITTTTIFLPLISSVLCGLFSFKLTHKQASWISILALLSTFIGAFLIFLEIDFHNKSQYIFLSNWLSSGSLTVNWGIYIDKLSAIMLLIVTFVSLLVHIYSTGYMQHDPHLPRFMSYLSLFTFFMIILVTADNFIQLFCGWEGVGFCSYLLIGFWYKKDTACNASIKAFIVNRIADFALVLAICLIFILTGSVEFSKVFGNIEELQNKFLPFIGYLLPSIEVISILIVIGCMGKSAQIGLHIWLADAMEGPTPVSALIHAATMVTAGIFMIARCSYLFEYAELALSIITVSGAITCIFASTIAITQNDIKKIIAYSTCSQLGYMFFACGVSAYNAGIFHLFTHAFFKALLFLSAGSVIHAVSGEQDIRKMGGLWNKLPVTYIFFWIGSLAIAGIFPFAGYYSKDLILEAAYASSNYTGRIAFWLGIASAFFTAFYSWRLLILVFHGKSNINRDSMAHVHESPFLMTIPISLLAFGSLVSGIYGIYKLNIAEYPGYFRESILILEAHNHFESMHELGWHIKALPTFAGIAGIIFAYISYRRIEIVNYFANWFKPIYLLSLNKYYIDEIYSQIFVKLYKLKAILAKIFDIYIIDRMGPDGVAFLVKNSAKNISKIQTGFISSYSFFILLGLVIPITWSIKNYI